ncbi:TetR/AcrR family transcriptional regulator [Pseudoduganella sp. OTU4001]|uniref:TetR/AcrR family transcriptional regulator n=1 Tax=Pseudoduganella sp. OTU4001 TaxID=3043854 RepID=UPI00313B994B
MSDLKDRPYRGINKEDRIAQRRDKLVESAIELFGGQGFANTSIKALCVNAGLTERSFYESFGVKEDLLQAAYLHARSEVLAAVRAAIASAEQNPAARSLAGVAEYLRQLEDRPAVARLLLFELEGVSEATNAVVRQVLRESSDLILHEMGAGLPAKPGGKLDGELLAIGMMGAIYQLAKVWVHGGYQLPREQVLRNAHGLYLGMLTLWKDNK